VTILVPIRMRRHSQAVARNSIYKISPTEQSKPIHPQRSFTSSNPTTLSSKNNIHFSGIHFLVFY
ncbi:MAG: hypothetical protein N4A62_01340, partial [Marinisporobacter sp.]|nr:hypothetical protein [Marinisporobacter sp.]